MNKYLVVVSLGVFWCFSLACKDKAALVELQQLKAQKEVEIRNAAAFRRFIEETDKGNYNAWQEIVAPDYQGHFPSNAKPISLDEHIQAHKAFPAAFPDFRHTIDDFVAQGDKVVFRETMRGTHKGSFKGLAPTGKTFEFTTIVIARFRDGKIAEMWMEADFMGLLQQLGMELRPKEEIKK
jgi:predicted ester cyclase